MKRSPKGAGTKDVRALREAGDPGRNGRCATIDGGGYTRPCKANIRTFYFVYPKPAIFVPDTEKCLFPWLIYLR